MVFVTDPDNLDRFQIAVDPLGEEISVRGLGTVRVDTGTTGMSEGSELFTDANANFTASGVAVGDTLSIISGDVANIIGHYTVSGSVTTTGISVAEQFIPTSAASDLTYKIALPETTGAVGEAVADGVTLQALYSFLKEEWRALSTGLGNAVDLIQFIFPLESITREQMEIGGATHSNWDFADDTTRTLIRTGGWQKRDSAGVVQQDYTGIITLGTLDTDAQVYFQQHGITVDPINFILTGAVNQSINTYNNVTAADAGTGFAITNTNTITRNDGLNWYTEGYRPGGLITIANAENVGNDGSHTVVSGINTVDGPLVVASTLTDNASDTTMTAAVNKRGFLKIFVRKKAKSYAQSEIADIGVATIETIVNRFPLTHATDAAISLDDGQISGDATETAFKSVEEHSTNTNGASVGNGDGTFDWTSAAVSPAFNDGVLQPGDSLEIETGTAGILGFYEIQSIVDADTIRCFDEPTKGITPDESGLTFACATNTRDVGASNATTADVDTLTGTLTSAGADFTTDDGLGSRIVAVNDIVIITADGGAVIGAYKVTNVAPTILTLNTSDQVFSGEINQTFIVKRPGMHLQYKSVDATQVVDGVGSDFNNVDPDTIDRNDGGSWVTDGYTVGMLLTVTNATTTANNGTYIISGVTTSLLTLITEEALTADTGDTAATFNGTTGFVRTLNNISYPFNWRVFGNSGTLVEVFQFIQRELRRATDIDEATGTSRGDVNDLLMTFASPTGVTLNMFIDDLASADFNNVSKQDIGGDSRTFAFIAGVTINLNDNLTGDTNAKVLVFFTDPSISADDEFGTNGAIIVENGDGTGSPTVMRAITAGGGDNASITAALNYTFDYDNNNQGTRTPGTDADVTIVAIGEETAQYVSTVGTISRQNNNIFSVVSSLERNFSNP